MAIAVASSAPGAAVVSGAVDEVGVEAAEPAVVDGAEPETIDLRPQDSSLPEASDVKSQATAELTPPVVWEADPWRPTPDREPHNFTVTGTGHRFGDRMLADQITIEAERLRLRIYDELFGTNPPAWSKPVSITFDTTRLTTSGGGTTTYRVNPDGISDLEIELSGTERQILSSALPTQISEAVIAIHYDRIPPRWAATGISQTFDSPEEQKKWGEILTEFLRRGRIISLGDLFAMEQVPHDAMAYYAEVSSLAQFLVGLEGGGAEGRQHFMDFVSNAMISKDIPDAIREYYRYPSVASLQAHWLQWVKAGSPGLGEAPEVAAEGARPYAFEEGRR